MPPKVKPPCGNPACGISTGICGSLTFGSGELDNNGYWEFPCERCERYFKRAGMDRSEPAPDFWARLLES